MGQVHMSVAIRERHEKIPSAVCDIERSSGDVQCYLFGDRESRIAGIHTSNLVGDVGHQASGRRYLKGKHA
jgi:hypothetical protein